MKPSRKEEDVVYVGIDDPVGLRRDVLEASKSLVRVLKGQHGVRDARITKHKLTEELRNRVTEIGELVADAKQMLPHMEKMNMPEEKKVAKPTKAATAKPFSQKGLSKTPSEKTRVETHIDKFERELQDIEEKLKSL